MAAFAAPGAQTLTQKALEVLGTAVLGPVGVLQVPDGPLLPAQQVLHLQARGGVAAGVRAEAGGDLEPPVGDGVVPRAEAWPVPEALFPSALLSETERSETRPRPAKGAPSRGSVSETRWAGRGRPFTGTRTCAPAPFSEVRTHSVTVTVRLRPREGQGREVSPHLLRRHHGYNRTSLFPHHLPKVRAGILQWSLSGNIVPFNSTDRDLKLGI